MAIKLPPVPLQDIKEFPYSIQEWFRKIQSLLVSTTGLIPWINVDKTGSSLTDLVTRDHNDLANKQGGTTSEYYHLTSANYTDLTDGGNSTLHYHSADRYTLDSQLTSIAALVDAAGWLHNDGAGTFAYSIPTASDVGAVSSVAETVSVATAPTANLSVSGSPITGAGTLALAISPWWVQKGSVDTGETLTIASGYQAIFAGELLNSGTINNAGTRMVI